MTLHKLCRISARAALVTALLAQWCILALSLRVLWAASSEVLNSFQAGDSPVQLTMLEQTEEQESGAHLRPTLGGPHRPDLDKLNKMLAKEGAGASANELEEAGPQIRIRRILVDLGPERSDVYVNGRKVGKTPYGGQVSCLDGETIQVQVVPARGVPINARVKCFGRAVKLKKEKLKEELKEE